MGKYTSDKQDIFFNLFEVLKVQDLPHYTTDESEIRDIIEGQDKFTENEIDPTRIPGDIEGVQWSEKGVKVPKSFHSPHKGYHEQGWFSLGMPEDVGGMPVPQAVTLACESLIVGANVAWSMYPGLSKAALNVLILKADDPTRSVVIPKMMEGSWGGTMCLTEPGAGSDVGAVKTTAVKKDGTQYGISGTKIFISSGDNDLYENIVHLVLARLPGAPEGTKGLSLFAVPKIQFDSKTGELAQSNHVYCSKIEHKMGIHGSATCELQFGEGGESLGVLIGKENHGMEAMFIMMNEARLLCGLQGEGQAHLVYEHTRQYCSERSQFGRELENHPDVRLTLLQMRARSRALRALHLYVGHCFDLAKDESAYEGVVELMTPICKSLGSDDAFQVAVDAIQLHGGYGYCQEYGVEQFARDIKIASIYEGTNAIQAIDFVGRKILKDGGKSLGFVLNLISEDVQSLPGEFQSEKNLLNEALEKMQAAVEALATRAKQKDQQGTLLYFSSFQKVSAYLFASWRLAESAGVACNKKDSGNTYYKEKIEDFKVYCECILRPELARYSSVREDSLAFLKV